MASLVGLRQALARRLKTINGLNVHATLPGSVTAPAAVVVPAPGTFLTFDSTMGRDSDDVELVIKLAVAKTDSEGAQQVLDQFLAGSGAKSIKHAVEDSAAADEDVHYMTVTEARDYDEITIGGIQYFGCELAVSVSATGR